MQNHCTNGQLSFFLKCIQQFICSQGGIKLILKTAPSCYDPKEHMQLDHVYSLSGFYTSNRIQNQHIHVSTERFDNLITKAEKRRLKKSISGGISAGVQCAAAGKYVYEFLRSHYVARGYQIPVSWCEFEVLIQKFPFDFVLFTASLADETVAAVVMVHVNPSVLYLFLSAYSPEFQSHSPVVLLMKKVYEYCQDQQISILDLGTSLDSKGNIKPSLSRFKKNIGALDSQKLTYEWTVNDPRVKFMSQT